MGDSQLSRRGFVGGGLASASALIVLASSKHTAATEGDFALGRVAERGRADAPIRLDIGGEITEVQAVGFPPDWELDVGDFAFVNFSDLKVWPHVSTMTVEEESRTSYRSYTVNDNQDRVRLIDEREFIEG